MRIDVEGVVKAKGGGYVGEVAVSGVKVGVVEVKALLL